MNTQINTPLPDKSQSPRSALKTLHALPKGIWALGFVSMFMDISSELVHSLLPVFMATILGASMTTIGLIEGIAEAVAAMMKVFSGAISDYLGKRKLLAVLGYGLAALTKPIFPLSSTIGWVFIARFTDRIGKGVRGAPRDALIAEITPGEQRGAAYGLRQSLDSVGAIIGPLAALAFMTWLASNIRAVLWIAVIPAFFAVTLLIIGVQEPERSKIKPGTRNPLTFSNILCLPFRFWLIVILGTVFTLARFSEAFLILRAQNIGLNIAFIPMVLIIMNIFYTLTAYPAGIAADQQRQRILLIGGLMMLIVADLFLAMATSPLLILIGTAFWGVHMGLTQGLFAKLVADIVPATYRGTAFGIFNLISGCALLFASLIAGILWNSFGAPVTFLTGAIFASFALFGLILFRKRPQTIKKKW